MYKVSLHYIHVVTLALTVLTRSGHSNQWNNICQLERDRSGLLLLLLLVEMIVDPDTASRNFADNDSRYIVTITTDCRNIAANTSR